MYMDAGNIYELYGKMAKIAKLTKIEILLS